MLVIRAEQMEVLRRHAEGAFTDRLCRHVSVNGARRLTGIELRERVERAIASARGFGITSERDVSAFVTSVFEHLGGLADAALPPQVLRFLTAEWLQPADKVARMCEWLAKPRRKHAGSAA